MIQSYDLYMPVHLVFGRGRIAELPKLIAGYGKKVLLTYGGGSVKRIGLYDKVKALLAGKASQTDADFGAVGESLEAIASHVGQQSEDFAAAKAALSEAQGAIAKLQQDFTALTTQLSRQPDPQQPARPAATGGNGAVQTDF